ncbi:unnamed protein product [Arctia plantaginis]|uniref:Uncharacterized protein n=1 Tax=Arctia plantaginis TaxID=874455 RepID=A0A8S0Z703_ARCPL|nr:unnamed protein product [Arctia plantaginis]
MKRDRGVPWRSGVVEAHGVNLACSGGGPSALDPLIGHRKYRPPPILKSLPFCFASHLASFVSLSRARCVA